MPVRIFMFIHISIPFVPHKYFIGKLSLSNLNCPPPCREVAAI